MSFPTGVPVVGGTNISSSVMNALFEMFRAELEDSLSRSGKGGMLAPFRVADGSVTSPALSFTQETGSGWYRAGAGDLRLAVLGAYLVKVSSALLELKGGATDGASAVAVAIDTANALANATAKLLSVRNAGTEKAAVDKDGKVLTPEVKAIGATSVTVKGAAADGAAAVGVVLDNSVTLANSVAKLLSVRNNGAERVAIFSHGGLTASSTTSHGIAGQAQSGAFSGVKGSAIGSGAGVWGDGSTSATGTGVLASGNAVRGPLNLLPQGAPSGPQDGDMWVETGTNTLKVRINGVTKTVTLT